MNLDGEDAAIVINILPLAAQHGAIAILPLSAHYRLLQASERLESGNLDSIDALLGCPMVLYDMDKTDAADIPSDRIDHVGAALCCAINWVRECANAFCTHADAEVQGARFPMVAAHADNVGNRQSFKEDRGSERARVARARHLGTAPF